MPISPEYSIIIPVYNHWEFTINCLESVRNYSQDYNYELLVVSNGSTDATAEILPMIQKSEPRLSFYACTEPLGFARAVNLGMKIAKGKYLIILNNDTKILAPYWIDMLRKPFSDPNRKVGVTGPLILRSPDANCHFVVFFCAMIKAETAKELGYLSEDFGWGYGEDIDFCKRCLKKGYEMVIVPENIPLKQAGDLWDGAFPIYHAGEKTVNDLSDWEKITEENRKKLRELYG